MKWMGLNMTTTYPEEKWHMSNIGQDINIICDIIHLVISCIWFKFHIMAYIICLKRFKTLNWNYGKGLNWSISIINMADTHYCLKLKLYASHYMTHIHFVQTAVRSFMDVWASELTILWTMISISFRLFILKMK